MALNLFKNLNPATPTAPKPAAGVPAISTPAAFPGLAGLQSGREKFVAAVTQQLASYQELTRERTTLGAEREGILKDLGNRLPRWLTVNERYLKILDELAALEEAIKSKVRTQRESIQASGILVEFSDPKSTVFDGELLLQLCPEAGRIPGLTSITVDAAVFDAAVASGRIPKEIVDRVRSTVPATKAGKVTFKTGVGC